MNLDSNVVLLILAGAVVVIAGVFVLVRRGLLGGPKVAEPTAGQPAKH